MPHLQGMLRTGVVRFFLSPVDLHGLRIELFEPEAEQAEGTAHSGRTGAS